MDDRISTLNCIWIKIKWIRGTWTLKQYYCSTNGLPYGTMNSLMSITHSKPLGQEGCHGDVCYFRRGMRYSSDICASCIWILGGQLKKSFRLFSDPLWSAVLMAAVQSVISFPLWRLCPNIYSWLLHCVCVCLCINILHGYYNWHIWLLVLR